MVTAGLAIEQSGKAAQHAQDKNQDPYEGHVHKYKYQTKYDAT